MVRNTRPVSWVKAARKAFEAFPQGAQVDAAQALTVVAEGGMPVKGLSAGVLELTLRHRSDAFRVVFALQLGTDVWVVHAFQKKAKSGIATPRVEIDVVRERLKRIKEQL